MTQASAPLPDPPDARVDETVLWATLADPPSDAAFHASWLSLLCLRCGRIDSGLLVLRRPDGQFAPAAVWPQLRQDVGALAETAEAALRDGQPVVQPLAGERHAGLAIGAPLRAGSDIAGVVVVATPPGGPTDVGTIVRQIHWASGLIEVSLLRQTSDQGVARLAASRKAFDIVAAIQDETTLQRAVLALVNEMAVACQAVRVSFGLVGRQHARLRAVSHAARFDRRSDLVHQLELAMEECLVQNETIRFPAQAGTRLQITAAHQALCAAQAGRAVLSVPMMAAGRKVCGILTIEIDGADDQRLADATETAQLIAALATPYLTELRGNEKLIAGRGPRAVRKAAVALVGAAHPGIKIAVLATAALAGWLALVPMPFWITARAVVEGEVQRAAVAPFDGYIQRAFVRAGDVVTQGQDLAALDDRDLRFEKLKWESERQKLDQRQREALSKFDRATVQVVLAQLDQADTELRLVEEKLQRARITAPISGYVVSGDLSQLLGSPVQQGKVLFEIAPLDAYRVTLQIDEVDIRHVQPGRGGQLTLTGAGAATPLTLTRLTSVTTPKDGRNMFRAEAQLASVPPTIRPGMEGVAKIDAGRAPLLWSWSRALVDRLRLLIWTWLP